MCCFVELRCVLPQEQPTHACIFVLNTKPLLPSRHLLRVPESDSEELSKPRALAIDRIDRALEYIFARDFDPSAAAAASVTPSPSSFPPPSAASDGGGNNPPEPAVLLLTPWPPLPSRPTTLSSDAFLGSETSPDISHAGPKPEAGTAGAAGGGGGGGGGAGAEVPGSWFDKLFDSDVSPVRPATPPLGGASSSKAAAAAAAVAMRIDSSSATAAFSRERRRRRPPLLWVLEDRSFTSLGSPPQPPAR